MIIAMAMTRDAAGRIIARHDGNDTVALNYPAGPGFSITTMIPPGTTVTLEAFETSRDPDEDARHDAHWGRPPARRAARAGKRAGPLGGEGSPANLHPRPGQEPGRD